MTTRLYNILTIFFCFLSGLVTQTYAQKAVEDGNLIISAVALYNDGDFDGAEGILEKAVSLNPDNDAAWYYLAMVSVAQDRGEAAEEYLRKAVALDSGNFWYRYRLANLYALTSRPELTVDIYEQLLKDFPKNSDLYFDLVELYAAQGEYQKSLDTIEEVETVFGTTESLAMYRFNLLMRMGKTEEAYKSLEDYNKEYSSPFVLSTLADHQLSMYNDSTALAYYNEALEIVPDYAPALLGKAETYRMTRKYDDYFSTLKEFVSAPESPAPSKTEYLMAVVQRSDPKFLRSFAPQFDTIVNTALEVHPSDSNVLRLAGIYYYGTGRNDMAKTCFKAQTDTWNESLPAAADYVEFLMYSQDWPELSREGRAAFERFPAETAFLEMASVGDYNMKDYDKVLEICNKVLEVAPDDSSATLRAWSTIGDIYHQKGDSKKSFKAYDKALKINPDYVYVLNNYAYYLSMEGKNLKKAYAMSKKTIEAEPDNATYLDTFGWILYLQGKALEAKPFFKHAMLYGGKESAVVMDHYAEVLYELGEYDLAFVYWGYASAKNTGELPGLDEKIKQRKEAIKK